MRSKDLLRSTPLARLPAYVYFSRAGKRVFLPGGKTCGVFYKRQKTLLKRPVFNAIVLSYAPQAFII